MQQPTWWSALDAYRREAEAARAAIVVKHDKDMMEVTHRVDSLESALDQMRGAKTLVYFLIGSNLLAVFAVLIGLVR